MSEDFHDHMKKEQELLNLSYQESLRQTNERMAVWDPGEKKTIFSQIKNAIAGSQRALTGWVVRLDPGNLLFRVKDWFYSLCEHYGGSISCWAWHKRWNKRNRRRYKHG